MEIADDTVINIYQPTKAVSGEASKGKINMGPEAVRYDHLGLGLPPGARHHRAYVGRPQRYDLASANQFNLLTLLGLRENHYLLDIGCGSLRAGRLFMMYLLPERYFGLEPLEWLIEYGIRYEIGNELVNFKKPTFGNDATFNLSCFSRPFDFILAQSVFTHAAASQISTCLSQARQVMQGTSIFAASFIESRDRRNYSGEEWVYPGSVSYTAEFIHSLAAQNGLECLKVEWPHPTGQTWLVFTPPDNQKKIPPLGVGAEQITSLQCELLTTKEYLARLQGDPFVRLALALRKFRKSGRNYVVWK